MRPATRTLWHAAIRQVGILSLGLMLGAGWGCTQDDPAPGRVLGRLGAAPKIDATLPRTRKVSLGRRSETALPLEAPGSIELPIPRGGTRLLFSVGTSTSSENMLAPATFRVEVRTTDRWAVLASIDADAPDQWHDQIEALPRGASAVRFSVRSADGEALSKQVRAWLGAPMFTGTAPGVRPAPNVILVSLDTLGASALSAFGGPPGVSPNLDRILAESGSYRRAFASFGATLVSHGALFSGRHPDNSGFLWYMSGAGALGSLAHEFGKAGFLTLAVTENGFVNSTFGFASGFDQYDDGPPKGSQSAEATFDTALRVYEKYAGTAPVFLFVHTYDVHTPYTAPDEPAKAFVEQLNPGDERPYLEVFTRNKGLAPQSRIIPDSNVARLRALYHGGVHHLDRLVADFMRRIEELDPERNTLVILTSDHGEEFEPHNVGHGGLDNDVLHVPLAFHWPGRIPPSVSDEPVGLIDVLPTALDLAGIPPPTGIDGRSLAPALRGERTQDGPGFAISRHHARPAGCKSSPCVDVTYAVQSERFKMVRDAHGDTRLYDLGADPNESVDVSDRHPDQVEVHTRWLAGALDVATPKALPAEKQIDPVTEDRLRALGYLD